MLVFLDSKIIRKKRVLDGKNLTEHFSKLLLELLLVLQRNSIRHSRPLPLECGFSSSKVSTSSNFDHTIGTQISIGNGEQIESYKKMDINGDGVPDMVIFYESGKIQLLINYSGSFKDMGYLAYVSDGGK